MCNPGPFFLFLFLGQEDPVLLVIYRSPPPDSQDHALFISPHLTVSSKRVCCRWSSRVSGPDNVENPHRDFPEPSWLCWTKVELFLEMTINCHPHSVVFKWDVFSRQCSAAAGAPLLTRDQLTMCHRLKQKPWLTGLQSASVFSLSIAAFSITAGFISLEVHKVWAYRVPKSTACPQYSWFPGKRTENMNKLKKLWYSIAL